MRLASVIAGALLAAAPLAAREMKQTPPPASPRSGFRLEFLRDLDEVEKKIIQLAEAVPADKYSWRPAPGVRSISEVYMHIAGGNYFLATFTGMKMPSYDTGKLEKITEKQRILDELRRSFEHLRTAMRNTTEADLDKPVKMFGADTTVRGAFLTALNHLHEHLGQSIAYARMNGVVPPWTSE